MIFTKFYYKILIVFFVILLAIDSFWIFSKYQSVKNKILETRKEKTVEKVLEKTKALTEPEHFTDPDFRKNAAVFESLFDSLRNPEFFRIKIWNKNYQVIWSSLPEIIGTRDPENEEVAEAISGEIAFEFKSLKPEQITERDFPNFSETYIPVRDESGEVVGIIEAYQSNAIVDLMAKEELKKSAWPVILGSILIYITAVFVIRFFVKKP